MIAALDVQYDEPTSSALAAAVVFENWEDEHPRPSPNTVRAADGNDLTVPTGLGRRDRLDNR